MAVYDFRAPTQFLYCLKNAACKEDGALVVVAVVVAIGVAGHLTIVEIVVVVNEIDLHSGRLQRCHLDDERVVCVIDDKVHARQAYYLVQLVASLVYVAPLWGENPDLLAHVLCCLWQVAANGGHC